jgi:hypothetical protein
MSKSSERTPYLTTSKKSSKTPSKSKPVDTSKVKKSDPQKDLKIDKEAFKYEVEFSVIITKSTDYLMDYDKRMRLDTDAYGRHRVESLDRVIDYDNRSIFLTAVAQVAERSVSSRSLVGQYPTREINVSVDATTTELILKLMGLVTDPPEDHNGEEVSTSKETDSEEAQLQKKLKEGRALLSRKPRGRPRKGKS